MDHNFVIASFLTGVILFVFLHNLITASIYRDLSGEYIHILNTLIGLSLLFSVLGLLIHVMKLNSEQGFLVISVFVAYSLIIVLQGVVFSRKYYFLLLFLLVVVVFFLIKKISLFYLTLSFAVLFNLFLLGRDVFLKKDEVINNKFFFNYNAFLIFLVIILCTSLTLVFYQSVVLDYVFLLVSSLSVFYSKLNYIFILRDRLVEENRKFSELYHTFVDEVLVAKGIIDRLLPTKKDVKYLDFDEYFRPAIIVGGDFFDIVELSESKHIVYVSDISGHGIPAGIISAMLKTLVLKNVVSSDISLEHLIKRLNSDFNSILRETARYSTMFVALIDKSRREIKYVSCGHTDVIYWDSNSGEFFYISSTAPILGLLEKIEVYSSVVGFNEGDYLIIPTDGLVSVMNKDGDTLGYEGLISILKKYLSKSIKPNELVFNVSRDIDSVIEDGSVLDDITMLAVRL